MNTRHFIRTALTATMLMLALNINATKPEAKEISTEKIKTEVRNALMQALDNIDDTVIQIDGKNTMINKDTIVNQGDSTIAVKTIRSESSQPLITIYTTNYPKQPASPVPDIIKETKYLLLIILLFLFPIVVIYLNFIFNLKQKRERNKIIETAIINGYDLPKEFYKAPNPRFRNINWDNIRFDTRNNGINILACGIGVMIFFLILGVEQMAALMLIPIIIGASKIITSRQIPRQDSHNDQDSNTPPVPPTPPTF